MKKLARLMSLIVILAKEEYLQPAGKMKVKTYHMTRGETIDNYIAALQERYPSASQPGLRSFANNILIAKSKEPNFTSTMSPQDVKKYTPQKPSDPGFIFFDQYLSRYDNTKPNNQSKLTTQVLIEQPTQIKTATSTKPIIRESEQGVTIIDQLGDTHQLQFDPLDKTYYYLDNNGKKILQDATLSIPKSVHAKIINSQKIENHSIDIQNLFNFNEITSIKSTLTNLWKDSKKPTLQDIKTTFDAIWKRIEKTFQVNISNSLKQITIEESIESEPQQKDEQNVDYWATKIYKKIVKILLNSIHKNSTFLAQSLEKVHTQSVSEMSIENQERYAFIKYEIYKDPNLLELNFLLNSNREDLIAQTFCDNIIKDIMGDRKLSQEEIATLHEQFLEDFFIYLDQRKPQPSKLQIKKDYTTFNTMTESNVTKETDLADLKKIYKQAALKLHPDKGGNPEDFSKLDDAYKSIAASLDKTESKNDQNSNFKKLLKSAIFNINLIKSKTIAAEKPLRDLAIKNISQDAASPSKKILQSIINFGIPTTNKNGTTTYLQNNSSVTVNSQGSIISMSNLFDTSIAL